MNFQKIVRIGAVVIDDGNPANLFVNVKFNDGKLSITGVEGPLRSGNCRGACGQIDMHEWNIYKYAEGWNEGMVKQLRQIWGGMAP